MTSGPTYLDAILDRKRTDLEAAKSIAPLHRLKSWAAAQPPALHFYGALSAPGMQVIAEIKRASPSRGVMAPDLDPVATAKVFAASGAATISVLTEEPHFQGKLSYLSAIKNALGQGGPPLLRKDFILEEYQVYESRAHGADALLLIAAALSDGMMESLLDLTHVLGMEALVEVHDEEEARRVVAAGARVIGINNRDLRTFKTSVAKTGAVRPHVPADRLVVSESGITSRQDVELLEGWGVKAILVGEALVTASDPGAKLRELRGQVTEGTALGRGGRGDDAH